jgi:hypothetical protein
LNHFQIASDQTQNDCREEGRRCKFPPLLFSKCILVSCGSFRNDSIFGGGDSITRFQAHSGSLLNKYLIKFWILNPRQKLGCRALFS